MCIVRGCKLPSASGGRYPDGLCGKHADEWCDIHKPFPCIPDDIDHDKLERAVANWILAEWQFRAGPQCFQSVAQYQLLKSEAKLRKALTGRVDLDAAHRILNGTAP